MRAHQCNYIRQNENKNISAIYSLHNKEFPIGSQSIKYHGSWLQRIYDANKMWQKWQGEKPLFADTFFFGKLVAIWPRSFLNALHEA